MKSLNHLFLLLICFAQIACSNTTQFTSMQQTITYHKSAFEKTVFTPVTATTIKKALPSDQQLLMSLLNRPITADQAMMLAFSHQHQLQNNYLTKNDVVVDYISIRGDKNQDPQIKQPTNRFSSLIANDIHAINIRGTL